MGSQTSLGRLPLPSDISDTAASLIDSAERVEGAVILFDAADNIVWVNERQRALMPCTDYVGQTYSSLFWSALDRGMVGNPVAVSKPHMWLEFSRLERSSKRLAQSINRYAWGDMALTHRRFDDGSSLQIRFATSGADADSPERLLLDAVAARREAAALRHALDNLDVGVAILDADGGPVHVNAAFRHLLAQDLGLALTHRGRVDPVHPEDYQVWQSAIAMARSGYGHSTLMMPAGDEAPLLAVTVMPGVQKESILVLATSLRGTFGAGHLAGLSDAFGIGEDDAEVIAHIANGLSLREIAARHRKENDGNVVSPFQHVAGIRHALRRHHLTVDNQAQIVALVQKIASITRIPLTRSMMTKEEPSDDDQQ